MNWKFNLITTNQLIGFRNLTYCLSYLILIWGNLIQWFYFIEWDCEVAIIIIITLADVVTIAIATLAVLIYLLSNLWQHSWLLVISIHLHISVKNVVIFLMFDEMYYSLPHIFLSVDTLQQSLLTYEEVICHCFWISVHLWHFYQNIQTPAHFCNDFYHHCHQNPQQEDQRWYLITLYTRRYIWRYLYVPSQKWTDRVLIHWRSTTRHVSHTGDVIYCTKHDWHRQKWLLCVRHTLYWSI